MTANHRFVKANALVRPSRNHTGYPLDFCLAAGAVASLPVGMCKYEPRHHRLVRILPQDKRRELASAALLQSWITAAEGIVVTRRRTSVTS